jgi:hypothetical protein
MTKPTKPKAKKPKAKKDVPLLEPFSDGRLCECGCGRAADTVDWDTGFPLSWNCVFERAKAANVSPP